jgi:hypothetical protein
MAGDRYVIVRVAYDRLHTHGRSLRWIAPELADAGLELIEDRAGEPSPSRTWAGVLSAPTFDRFADAWRLHAAASEPVLALATEAGRPRGRDYTLDGMNWESGGESPIVYVSVHVTHLRDRGASEAAKRSRVHAHA